MSDNFNVDLKKFAENAKKIKKSKEDFDICLNAEITELEVAKNKLFKENEQVQIYNQLVKLDINSISVPKVGRVQTILDFVSQEYLSKYRNHFLANYNRKEIPETPKRPESSDKSVIQQFNETVKKWQEEVKLIKDWNTKYNVLTEYLDSIITIDLYGDTTLNVTDLPYVYFKFLNTDIDEIEVFMQELKTCPASPVKKIKSIRIEDIKDKLPAFVKSAKEVRVYLENDQDANELHGSADYVGGVYEKYVIKNDLMKKDGGEWGLYNQRKDNLNNPTIGNFNLQSVPTPVNLNSGQAYEPEEEFYKDNYEVTLSECFYTEAEFEGETVFAIVPKLFWGKYKTILVNKRMKIDGVTDNSQFKRKDIYFQFLGDVSDAYSALDDAEYSHDLNNYVDNKNEVIAHFYNQYNIDVTNGFTFEFLNDDYDEDDYLSDDEENFYINIAPKDDISFDQCIESAVFLYLNKEDVAKLSECSECMFEFEGTIGEFKKMIAKYSDMFSGNTELDDDIEDSDEIECNSAKDFIWAVNVMENDNNHLMVVINPKKYWNKYKALSDVGGEGAENFIIKGYELDEEAESQFSLRYANTDKYVTKLSELKLVMEKSDFEFSWEMQNFLDNYYCLLDSNNFNTSEEFFDALKEELGQ